MNETELADLFTLADHIEMEHEREIAPPLPSLSELRRQHRLMHEQQGDLPHTHREVG